MDGSFLSQPKVVAAAGQFVCVRLTTYENKAEAGFLKAICPTGSGELENTVFTILAPDGKRQLARASRSAREVFGDADRMAETMNRVAGWYKPRPTTKQELPELPTVANVRLAIDVAACDNQPLVLLFSKDAATRQALAGALKPLAWSEEFRGRFIYAEASGENESAPIQGTSRGPGVLVIQPDRFGLAGRVLKSAPAGASVKALAQCLRTGAAMHRPQVESFRDHVRDGRATGAFWETVLPVSDPMERAARQR
jgi:hypothetical protein